MINSQNKSLKRKGARIVKIIGIALVFVIAYGVSVYTSSFVETNNKLVSLFLYALIGFLGFYLIYYVFYLISLIIYKKRLKKRAKVVIDCDDNVEELFSNGKHRYNYDLKVNLKSNLNAYKDAVVSVVKEIAEGYNLKKGELNYLNFTVYDAIEIIQNAIDGIDSKISPIFKFLRAEDKPLSVVEKLLISAIENQPKPEELEPPKSVGFMSKIISKAKSAGMFLIKGSLENALNDVLIFIGYEAFKVYGKEGDKYLPVRSDGGDENA